ncbi:DoxX family protein [Brucella sp. BE17]|uniref:DoxX family protein n=1 Tax=Brucella sp. BE17 TaxID=3142977 RepID=UPI0031BADCA8
MSSINAPTNGAVTLVARILLTILFIPSGFSKLTAISGTAGYFANLGLPLPTVTAVIVGLIEFVGGIAVLIGFKTRVAAILLGLFTIGAALIGHAVPFDETAFFKNMAIAGGFFVLTMHGAGSISVDAKRA